MNEVAERKKEFRTTVDGTEVKRVYTAGTTAMISGLRSIVWWEMGRAWR